MKSGSSFYYHWTFPRDPQAKSNNEISGNLLYQHSVGIAVFVLSQADFSYQFDFRYIKVQVTPKCLTDNMMLGQYMWLVDSKDSSNIRVR